MPKKKPPKNKPKNKGNSEIIMSNGEPYITDNPKKIIFIEAYRQLHGHISDSCRTVEIARQTYYDWLDKDTNFAIAIANEDSELNDEMRQAIIHKAQDGDTTALIFWLKYRHPDFKLDRMIGVRGEDAQANKIEVIIKDYE